MGQNGTFKISSTRHHSNSPFSASLSLSTGDAIPKRPFLKHGEYLTYSLLIPAVALTWVRRVSLFEDWRVSVACGLLVGAIVTYAVSKFGAFTLFKLYPEGYGAGFNLYWKGWRAVGLDWHQWVIRQDLKTRKPLAPDQQYALNRPHIDLPLWEYHHWPWTQLPHSNEAAATKAAKDIVRAAAAEKKAERKARRAAVLAERGSKGDKPTSEDAKEENKNDDSESIALGLLGEDDNPTITQDAANTSTIAEAKEDGATDRSAKAEDKALPKIFESSETATRKTRAAESTTVEDENKAINAEDAVEAQVKVE